MRIPVFDLAPAVEAIAEPLGRRWQRLLDATAFVGGAEVAELEESWAAYLGQGCGCVGVANGTDALVIALRALGVGAGDEVVVPALSFFATAEAVALLGARPVFADVEPETLNLDPRAVARCIGPRTRGIVAVHLYGHPAELDQLTALSSEHGLFLLEDAAQAHGARFRGRPVGTFGELAAWSFYPSKNFGCFGDGGAITGIDGELLREARLLANHGQSARYQHQRIGTNSRLDALQAAVLCCRLPSLDADNQSRRRIATRYRQQLAGADGVQMLAERPGVEPVYHQLTIRVADRQGLQSFLAARGIGSAVHYPEALHRLAPMQALGPQPELPVAEAAARQVLSLPMHPTLEESAVDEVAAAVREFCGSS